jgi:hypothetical protein
VISGENYSLEGVKHGGVSGVSHGDELLAFAEALVVGDDTILDRARRSIVEAMGVAAFVEAAGVAAQFIGIVRVADATGIPTDPGDEEFSAAIQAELGISEKSWSGDEVGRM